MSILEYLLILDACISCAGINLLLGLIYIYHQNAKKKMQIAILMRQNQYGVKLILFFILYNMKQYIRGQ
jgi:hypothetical protein